MRRIVPVFCGMSGSNKQILMASFRIVGEQMSNQFVRDI